jgi:hypothetical protein
MRAQKMREEAIEKERDGYFNIIQPVISTKQEWRVKEKVDTSAPMTSDDDMDLLNDNEAPLMKDGSLPPSGMDINMVFTLPTELRGVEEEVTQMCLIPEEAMFEKPEESSQHLKPLYIRGHIDREPVSRMLIDGDVAVNLMPYSIFKKLGREDDKLVKTNLTLKGVGGNPMEAHGVISMELTVGSKSLATVFVLVEVQGNFSAILGRDWIHANRCVPSTLHQFLIQWIDNEIEVVRMDASTYVAIANATADWQHGGPSACQRGILQATTFLASQRKVLCPCL